MELIVIIVGGFMLWITIGILFPDVFKKDVLTVVKSMFRVKNMGTQE